AIVYVMDSQKAYTATDKNQLEMINALGRKNILTGYTFYDIVERQTRRTPERLRTLRKTLINHMMKHTDLGEVSIHFLDSIGGLDAKLDNDREALRKSGFEGFEDYLGQYLVEGKGSAQVKEIINVIVNQADAMIKDAQFLNNAAMPTYLSKTLDEAEARLQAARDESKQRSKNYRQSLEERLPEVEQMVRTFLTEELPEHIDLEDFQPETSLPNGISKLYPMECRRKLRVIKKECEEEVLRRINFEFKVWANKMLSDYVATDKFTIVLPISLFAYIDLEAFHIISRDISSAKKIKFLVAKYAREFFRDVSTKEEVDNMVSDIMFNVKSYVEKTCAGAEKILRDEVENTERLVRRMVEDGKATLEEKTAQISQRNAAIDKLNNIKDQALRIGRDHGIRF
ncbi:MAG: hypothetical protein IJP42_11945, partial [Selenomonadaceae bacterium]|nr:hypothetical protein [Selenomonadaceae bacterium]